MAVRCHPEKVVVVHMALREVIGARVSLVGAVEPVMMDGSTRNDVLGPTLES